MDGGTELARARPPVALVHKGAGQGAGEGEGSAGDPFRASPKVRLWWGGRAMAMKVAAGRTSVRFHSGLGIGARRSGGEAVRGRAAAVPFHRVGGGAGRPGDGGERAAAVVRYNGGGGGYFGRGSAGAVGSDEGGALVVLGAEGGVGRQRVCAHARRWWR
jgi:hypothetical protein